MEGRTKTGDIDNIRGGRFGGLLFCSGSFLPPPIPLAEKVTFFARAGLEAMATIYNAVVFGGIGVFSKNIKYQMPHLVWQFPDIKDIHPGSINVQLEGPLHVARYDCTTLPIPWLHVDDSGEILGWQFERFSFLEIQFEPMGGRLHRAWIMDCHHSATFHKDPTRFEIISEKIAGVANGQRCRLHIP